ncbi:MAG: ABC transporter permease subunit [Gemmataceae bacterium]|nr:ABC transporter permease subunit [Gemmataceae bacterium]
MKSSIIRIIWAREMRDLLRDRRTLFMIFLLPVALYPLLGLVGYSLALGSVEQRSRVGVSGIEYLPTLDATSADFSPVPAASWFAWTPGHGIDGAAGAAALVHMVQARQTYPPLILDDRFVEVFCRKGLMGNGVDLVPMTGVERALLEDKTFDALLVIPPDLLTQLDAGGQPAIQLYARPGDERSRQAERRVKGVVNRWKQRVKEVRFLRRGLAIDFDNPVVVVMPEQEQSLEQQTASEISDMVARFFPFIIIMWSLAGALYPAIDVCAGEKERGTLETLLLSPATRTEIVCGKFLAIWVFASATALWNLLWMAGGTLLAHYWVPFPILRPSGVLWSMVLTVQIAALFSAVSLALGAYAKSTKEGQYYLMPVFLLAVPLTFWPLLPGVELNLTYSLVPITGATLLLQRLMLHPEQAPWGYFAPVLLSLTGSIALALRWAVMQFQREEVLFREAQRLGLVGQLRRLFRNA